ncbi:hypothetical protein DVW05_16275 [Clostridium botulinum]|nr:hypothetical protein [Clostridium botulinum]NFS30011.1 hypothetical protein [Clostridium botulinum]NFS54553.1 hypothetical protein [Clostridium botulinum]NFT17523.1 hypothetical protein [Clostridium botulinum]
MWINPFTRIRDISEIKLYYAGKVSEYSKIESILNGQIKTKTIEENFDDILPIFSLNVGFVGNVRGISYMKISISRYKSNLTKK